MFAVTTPMLLAIPNTHRTIESRQSISLPRERLRGHTRTFDSGISVLSASRRTLPAEGILKRGSHNILSYVSGVLARQDH